MKLHTITIGSTYEGTVKIIKKINVGPVIILMVTDGTKIVDAVVKHTEFDAGDVVSIRGFVGDRNGSLRIEVQSIQKSTVPFDTVIADQAKVAEKAFSIRSERFEKLKPYFYDIAFKIRKAVLSGQPILIRHHNDTDGISAGLALEESCKMLMESVGIDANKSLYRAVCKAPFYETPDMLKDLSLSKRLQGFGQLKPLIIVTDNGSTPEDVNAMKSMHALGHDIIVIDHHNPVVLENKKTAVCPYLIAHMNPYIEGLDGKTCCGMLNYELGRLIFDGFDSVIFAAISGISDRCDIQETEDYIAKTGIDREHLKNIGTVIDYVSYNLRFDTASDVYYEVLNNKKFVDTLLQEVKTGMETQLQSTLPYVRTQEINGVVFSHIDLEKYTMRFTYPTAGRVIGAIHDRVAESHSTLPVLTIGYVSDMVIVRATQPVLPVETMIKNLQKALPGANVDGGGHECAGTLKFVNAHLQEVIENIKQQVKDIQHE